ncbi:hypothetical protein MAJ_02023, partial [Metarhizium majus ARSEF 297]
MRNARAEDTGLPKHVSQKNAVVKDHSDCALGVQTGRLSCLRQPEPVFTAPWRASLAKYPL